jgi:2-iminobutanoate/2-iminopropanoate deaminase
MTEREAMNPEGVRTPAGPYSHAVRAGDLIFVAGQIGASPETGELAGETAAEQATQALANLGTILEAAGSGLHRVVKTTCFLADMADYNAFNEAYAAAMPAPHPARSTFAVRELPRGARVEIEAVALAGRG